jgi:tetratricopeptide (TPR) repeat protein
MNKQNIDFKSKLESAYNYYQRGKQEKSIELFDQVLSLQQQNSKKIRTEGVLIINLERFTEAISYFDNILKQNPQDNEIIFRKGIALEMMGDYENALVQYNMALKHNHQNICVCRNKGFLLINLERFTEAISYFDNILKQNPQDREILFSKAIALELLGKNESAIPFYIKSLKIQSEDTESMINFMFHFLSRLRIWDPIEFYQKLIDTDPNESFAEFFKQFLKNETQIELFYKKYLNRIPDLDEIKHWQIKIFKKDNSEFLENEIMESSEAQINIQGKKYEADIKKLFKKYLDRKNLKQEELNAYSQQILNGKSLKTIEEEIKNSDEGKQLPYWQDDE